jgi:fermentation-respiration switch protein FrsA (DUF1100 family)
VHLAWTAAHPAQITHSRAARSHGQTAGNCARSAAILDWRATLNYQGRLQGISQPLTSLAEILLAWRTGPNYTVFDQLRRQNQLRVPILLIQGTADTIVPPAVADAFARAAPGLVTYLRVPGADHESAIDTNPTAYRAALDRFLGPYS